MYTVLERATARYDRHVDGAIIDAYCEAPGRGYRDEDKVAELVPSSGLLRWTWLNLIAVRSRAEEAKFLATLASKIDWLGYLDLACSNNAAPSQTRLLAVPCAWCGWPILDLSGRSWTCPRWAWSWAGVLS